MGASSPSESSWKPMNPRYKDIQIVCDISSPRYSQRIFRKHFCRKNSWLKASLIVPIKKRIRLSVQCNFICKLIEIARNLGPHCPLKEVGRNSLTFLSLVICKKNSPIHLGCSCTCLPPTGYPEIIIWRQGCPYSALYELWKVLNRVPWGKTLI